MKNYTLLTFLLFPIILLAQEKISYVDYVDPTIGGVGVVLEPTRPTVHLPNSMVRFFPVRKDQLDDQIDNYPLLCTSHRLYNVFSFLPVSGNDGTDFWNKKLIYRHETLSPYYYKATFEEAEDKLEFTPHKKSAFIKVHFNEGRNHSIRLAIINGNGQINISGKRQISGTEEFAGMKAYFYAETDTDVDEVRYKNQSDKKAVLLEFGDRVQTVSFRYGVSYISIEQAKQNLQYEIPHWDFNKVKDHARKSWEGKLSQIKVEGGTESQKRVFYTALYRSYERMVDINEYGHYYSAYDKSVHESNEPFYVDNWIWDNYIALEPLNMILDPERSAHQISSYIKMYEQGGYIPSFALVFGDWPAMTGNFAATWIADAWFKGIRDYDLPLAYRGLKKNSLNATLIPWRNGPKTELDEFYNDKGYMPGLPPGEKESVAAVDTVWEKRQSVSVTTANSYSDWCIAQLARELELQDDVDLFLQRSLNYRNVYRKEQGFMWPKDAHGNWIEPFDPRFAGREYFTENNAYTYNWDVKHDLRGLFSLMGGEEMAEDKLDQLFREELGLPKWKFWNTQPDASGLVGQFVMGNEPSFHIPYIYNYLGAPWKTQKRIRMLLDSFFTDNLFGIPGDEDGGGMSAFIVLSQIGIFPVTPGIPVYNIGSPTFNKAAITLPNGKEFMVIAHSNSGKNVYIQKAMLNGKPLNKPWIKHSDVMDGGVLELTMGDSPNKEWGSNGESIPPSYNSFINDTILD